MLNLFAALVVLFISHWLPSHPAIRPKLVNRIGLHGFRIAYSILSFAVTLWVILAYKGAWAAPFLWYPPFWMRWMAVGVMPIAIWLILVRLLQKPKDTPSGIYRLILAPGSAGFLLWSVLHLLNMGHARAVLLFSVFAAISLAAYIKNVRSAPPEFRSVGGIPLLSVLRGRQRATLAEFSLRPILLTLVLWGILLVLHPYVIGADPLAGLSVSDF